MNDIAVSYLTECLLSGHTHGDGSFSERCHRWLEVNYGTDCALLTSSCSSALDMCALLCEIGPGDEVILPSFTFSSTANAFLLRGAKLRFAEISQRTLNLDPQSVAEAVTENTKVIVPVHYAGVACEMEAISAIGNDCDAMIVEDAAQGIEASWRGRALGTVGQLGALSFHNTKNVSCGEGGALLINDERLIDRAHVIREKGTNRASFMRGDVEKYTWVDIGSSFLLSDLSAAVLLSQLEKAAEITAARLQVFARYMDMLKEYADSGMIQLPCVPDDCQGNAHIFYLLTNDSDSRDRLITYLKERDIPAAFHYVPLHSSPMGVSLGYRAADLPVTESIASRIVRLPVSHSMPMAEVERVAKAVAQWCRSH